MGSGSIFTVIALGIVSGILYAVFTTIKKLVTGGRGKPQHCMTCGSDGPTKQLTRGSIWIEIVLWLAFIVPGLIYSVWRMTTRKQVCGTCTSETVIPLDSPSAIAHRKSLTSA